ncbi:MAG TPA: hypothetical protein VN493_21120 [Thermoanaerobaculia bacterium]|nr:hypothetical protein [Thermoanaerobaculia bacterium]
MTTCTLRPARIVLLTLTLGLVFAGLALAQKAPVCAERLPGKSCPPAMSTAAQPAVNPLKVPDPSANVCYWAIYDEFWKNGEICRWRNSCDGPQYHGTCPNGYDDHITEIIPCCH